MIEVSEDVFKSAAVFVGVLLLAYGVSFRVGAPFGRSPRGQGAISFALIFFGILTLIAAVFPEPYLALGKPE